MPDPERIYLEPGPPYSPEGRLWSTDDVWPCDPTDPDQAELGGGVEYVRADLYERVREALEVAEYSERWTDARGSQKRCPVCGCGPHQGHRPDCVIGRALSEEPRPPDGGA